MNLEVRPGGSGDLDAISRIQAGSPEASQWDVREYLKYELNVAILDSRVVGFAVSRPLAEGENELLNLAVDPQFRRHGVGRRLVAAVISGRRGILWLEVRESNLIASKLYESLGFITKNTPSAIAIPRVERLTMTRPG